MDYDSLETEITEVLNTYFGATVMAPDVYLNTVFLARRMPENPEELVQEYDKALVNVSYADSSYGKTRAADIIQQEETVQVALFIQCNKMKGADGGWALVRHIKKALLGYKPSEATTKLVISSYGDWRLEEGEMRPFIEFSCNALNLQEVANPSVGTIDSEGTIANGGNLVIVDSDLYE